MVKVGRERADLALQLKENEEEMQELIKKYKVGLCLRHKSTISFVKPCVTMCVTIKSSFRQVSLQEARTRLQSRTRR